MRRRGETSPNKNKTHRTRRRESKTPCIPGRLCNPAEALPQSGNPKVPFRLSWVSSKTRSAPPPPTGILESAAALIGPPTPRLQRPCPSRNRATPCPACRRNRNRPFSLNPYSSLPLASVFVARSACLVPIPAQTQRSQRSTPLPELRSLSPSHVTSVNAVYAQYTGNDLLTTAKSAVVVLPCFSLCLCDPVVFFVIRYSSRKIRACSMTALRNRYVNGLTLSR